MSRNMSNLSRQFPDLAAYIERTESVQRGKGSPLFRLDGTGEKIMIRSADQPRLLRLQNISSVPILVSGHNLEQSLQSIIWRATEAVLRGKGFKTEDGILKNPKVLEDLQRAVQERARGCCCDQDTLPISADVRKRWRTYGF